MNKEKVFKVCCEILERDEEYSMKTYGFYFTLISAVLVLGKNKEFDTERSKVVFDALNYPWGE